MTQPPCARLSTGRLPCVSCVSCRASWGIVAERLDAIAWQRLGIGHPRTAPTALRPTASTSASSAHDALRMGRGAIYRNSDEHTAALDGWLWRHNCQRRHSALGHKPSIARLDARMTNFLGPYP